MKLDTMLMLLWLTMILACLVFAFYMAIKGIGGWGWFLGVVVFLAASFSYGADKDQQEDKND